jgi:translocation and assembly module TamA
VSADLAEVARQQTVIEPGDVYSPRTLERAEINLRFLRLFRRIQVDTAEREGTADVLDVIMQLSPRHYPALELGVGYWTDDGLRGQASWEHRNLLGRGRGLRAALRAGQFEQRGRLSTWLATLWKSRAQATTALELLREDEESYELLEGSLELTLTYPFSFRTVGRVGVSLSYAELSVATGVPAALDRPPGTLTEVFARWDQDGTDDRIQPSDGYWVRWSATVAPPGLGSPTSYLRGETEGTLFRPLGPTVVAVRLLVGAGSALEDGQALFANRRFFAGGASSMRGFERRQLGPQDADGDPIGGEAKLETSLDLRFPLVWRLHGALFVDAAQVWLEARDVRPFDLEVAYGPGLLLDTPIGPIRGDLGLRAGTFDGGFPEYQLHLSIGQPF